jgi:integrase
MAVRDGSTARSPRRHACGRPLSKPHALHHTFASLLLQQGESPVYVKEQMGHHSTRITVDTYGHLIPGANKTAVDRLDDATGRTLYATDVEAAQEPVR